MAMIAVVPKNQIGPEFYTNKFYESFLGEIFMDKDFGKHTYFNRLYFDKWYKDPNCAPRKFTKTILS
jgi:hypothetical protein